MTNNSSQNTETITAINGDINSKITHYQNVDQNYITITEDRIKLTLNEYLKKIEDKNLWIAPLGIFITLILIPLTTEKFKDFLSIPASVWQAVCYIAMIIFAICLIHSVYKSWLSRNITIEHIIEELKRKSEKIN